MIKPLSDKVEEAFNEMTNPLEVVQKQKYTKPKKKLSKWWLTALTIPIAFASYLYWPTQELIETSNIQETRMIDGKKATITKPLGLDLLRTRGNTLCCSKTFCFWHTRNF